MVWACLGSCATRLNLLTYQPTYPHTADGDPIIFERLGEVDVEKVMKMAADEEVVRYVARNLEATNEYQTKHSKELGKHFVLRETERGEEEGLG